MRPGIIIAIVVAAVVLIGGFVWYNNDRAEQARIEAQRSEQAAQTAREEEDLAREAEEERARVEERAREEEADRAREELEAADTEQSAPETEESRASTADDTSVAGADQPIIVGDEIPEGAIVVESAPGTPTVMNADEMSTSTEFVDGNGSASTGAPERLLTPDGYERDEILALINGAEQLTPDERTTLRAMVDGATANPETREATIASLRAAFDLPALD